jgi:hypothetical protein
MSMRSCIPKPYTLNPTPYTLHPNPKPDGHKHEVLHPFARRSLAFEDLCNSEKNWKLWTEEMGRAREGCEYG